MLDVAECVTDVVIELALNPDRVSGPRDTNGQIVTIADKSQIFARNVLAKTDLIEICDNRIGDRLLDRVLAITAREKVGIRTVTTLQKIVARKTIDVVILERADNRVVAWSTPHDHVCHVTLGPNRPVRKLDVFDVVPGKSVGKGILPINCDAIVRAIDCERQVIAASAQHDIRRRDSYPKNNPVVVSKVREFNALADRIVPIAAIEQVAIGAVETGKAIITRATNQGIIGIEPLN